MDKLLDVEGSNVTRVSERLLVRRKEREGDSAGQPAWIARTVCKSRGQPRIWVVSMGRADLVCTWASAIQRGASEL